MAEELDKNEDFSKVIEFLNSKEGFQPFGKRLAVFIAKKLDLDSTDRKTLVQALNEACGKTGVDLSEIASDGTLRNWFDKDMRPKKGDDSRLSMFALAFALQLSVDETKELFHKIFLDRAFNYRNEKEVIYYFCLKNNKTWADAKRMIAEVENMTIDISDHTQLTNVIVKNVDVITGLSDEYLTDLVIPETIEDLPVTAIKGSAFSGCSQVTSITVPKSVTSIGNGAFKGTNPTKVTLPFVGNKRGASGSDSDVFGYVFGFGDYNTGAVIGILTFAITATITLFTYRRSKAYNEEDTFQ